jgi:hypothetical protein
MNLFIKLFILAIIIICVKAFYIDGMIKDKRKTTDEINTSVVPVELNTSTPVKSPPAATSVGSWSDKSNRPLDLLGDNIAKKLDGEFDNYK